MKKPTSLFLLSLFIYVLVQFIYVTFFPLPFISDSKTYFSFAESAIHENTYYPNPSSLYTQWLAAPAYINYVIALLKLYNSPSVILFFNIILNLIQLLLVYKITKKIFDRRAAIIASVLYMIYLNNLGLVLQNLTELPFGVLILASINFYISRPTIANNLLCGLTLGLAIGVRPTGWALVIAFVILYVISLVQGKGAHAKLACILIGILLYIVPMGLLAKRNVGQFEYMSTTGPANLIMSANPRAKGVFDPHFFYNDSIYLTKKTFIDRQEYLIERSKEYIAENPKAWISLIPRKLYSTFISDGWSIPYLLNDQKWDLNFYIKGDADVKHAFRNESIFFRIAFWGLNIWQQLIYGLIAIFFVYQLYLFVRSKPVMYETLVINLFILGGVSLSILSSVGAPRYKYNFLIAAIILISPLISDLVFKYRCKVKGKS